MVDKMHFTFLVNGSGLAEMGFDDAAKLYVYYMAVIENDRTAKMILDLTGTTVKDDQGRQIYPPVVQDA